VIEFASAPVGNKFIGWFRVDNGKVRLCGHIHDTEFIANKCAGTRARAVAKEEK